MYDLTPVSPRAITLFFYGSSAWPVIRGLFQMPSPLGSTQHNGLRRGESLPPALKESRQSNLGRSISPGQGIRTAASETGRVQKPDCTISLQVIDYL